MAASSLPPSLWPRLRFAGRLSGVALRLAWRARWPDAAPVRRPPRRRAGYRRRRQRAAGRAPAARPYPTPAGNAAADGAPAGVPPPHHLSSLRRSATDAAFAIQPQRAPHTGSCQAPRGLSLSSPHQKRVSPSARIVSIASVACRPSGICGCEGDGRTDARRWAVVPEQSSGTTPGSVGGRGPRVKGTLRRYAPLTRSVRLVDTSSAAVGAARRRWRPKVLSETDPP